MAKASQQPFPEIVPVNPTARGETTEGLQHVQKFLVRFGYLSEGVYQPNVLDEPTAEALTTYQTYQHVRVTGEFDEEVKSVMTTARCAHPDLANGVAFSTRCAWDRLALTFAFDTDTNDLAAGAAFQAVRNAFQTWANSIPLTFTEVALNQNPDIRIGWRPANDPDLSMVGGTLAHADFPPNCSVVTNTLPMPVHFDDTEHIWVIGAASGGFDVETVALHEIGHIIGLQHSNVTGAVMFPTVSDNSTLRTLTADDIDGARNLYPLVPRWAPFHSSGDRLRMMTVGMNQDGRLEAFGVASDETLWHTWQTAPNNGWSAWAPFHSSGDRLRMMTVGMNQDGRLEAFGVASDETLWHTWQTAPNNGWSAWAPFHSSGDRLVNLVVARNQDGRLEAFGVASDETLWHTWQTAPNNGWNT